MRRLLILAVAAALIAGLAPVGKTTKETLTLARVSYENKRQQAFLSTNFDETHHYIPGEVEILVWPGDLARLEARGFDYDIIEDDVVAADRQTLAEATLELVQMPGPDRENYRILGDYATELKQLAKKNPGLVKLFKAPHKTLEGRTVFGVEIAANVKRQDGRPTLYIDGLHHAREWPAAEYPMIFAHYLVEGFGKNKQVTQFLRRGRAVIIPIVNPDGFDYSRSSPFAQQSNVDAVHGTPCSLAGCEGYWRKNRRSFSGATVPGVQKNPDAYGVDPNRNYAWLWGGPGASEDVYAQTHHGEAPFSEPESRNVEKTVLSNNVTSIITNHTYSRLVLRPWGETYLNSPDEKYLFKLGAKMAKAMGGYQNIKGIQLYPTTGTTSDWGYGTLGIPSYTFEHGLAFHPPYSGCEANCVGKEWPGVMKAFMYGAQAALDSDVHGVVSGRVVGAKGPAKLQVTKKIATPLTREHKNKKVYTETIKTTMTTGRSGAFTWHLPPSIRPPRPGKKAQVERYMLTASGKGGKKTLRFVLRSGQRVRLGTIRL